MSSTSSTGVTPSDLSQAGLVSGFDWKTFVQDMAQAERAPETQWSQEQQAIDQKNSAYGNIKTLLTTLQTSVTNLNDPTLYQARTAQASDTTIATATSDTDGAVGTFNFNIATLATAASINGISDVAQKLASDGNMNVLLSNAGFSSAPTDGTFTVDGQQITITDTTAETIQQVFDAIAQATNNKVKATYDSGTDTINLASTDGSEVVLGSATDTSNFLQIAHLTNNGTDSTTSSNSLGGARMSVALDQANLATAVTDSGSPTTGSFSINGVAFNYDASTDSISDLVSDINSSSAGVTATYDSLNDRFVLTNKTTGDIGIAMQDTSGHFLQAVGLLNGTLEHGQNLTYTVNGSETLTSQSNTITQDSSGIAGLSVSAIKAGAVSVTVGTSTDNVSSAINDFVNAYNGVQSYIDGQTASTTDSNGNVTAGTLTGDGDASDITSQLRDLVFAPVSGLTGTVKQLADLGIQTNGNDDTLTISDAATFNSVLASNLDDVKQLFTNATTGIAPELNTYLTNTIGDSGTLIAHQDSLTKQSSAIDTQVTNLETQITSDSNNLTNEFVNMETAEANINQQLAYLSKAF